MARRRYFRYYPRTRVAKKKWASNFKSGQIQTTAGGPLNTAILVQNKAQSDAPTPTIIKTGNFKVQGDVYYKVDSTRSALSCVVYVLFVPEGFGSAVSGELINNHPEWIMGWSLVDTSITSTTETLSASKFSITSRLKRNLNSGDQIVLALKTVYESSSTSQVLCDYVAQYWTCAN